MKVFPIRLDKLIIQECIFVSVFVLLFCSQALAQVNDTTKAPPKSRQMEMQRKQDSIRATQGNPGGPPGRPGGGAPQSGSLKKGEIQFQSADSLVFDFRGNRTANLFGSASVNAKAGKLKAGKVTLNLDKNIVKASTQTPKDTLSEPVLSRQGKPPVRSKKITFNYSSKKGRFVQARVNIHQGQVIGTVVKNTSTHVIYLKNAKYSTCTLPHPHYYIKAQRMKIVKRNGKQQIFFQHAMLYLLDIPYPLVFPFGYVPGKIAHRKSGLLTPTYASQQKATRGLGIQNLGWFEHFSNYVVGQASVDVYTSGTFYLNAQSSYRKRNSYNGSVKIGYSREQGLEPTDPGNRQSIQKNLQIQHSQKFSPYSHLSADINLRTKNYFKRNSYNINQRAQTSTGSHINYSYQQPENLYTFDASMQQNINFQTNTTQIEGPSFNFNLRQISPFRSKNNRGQSSKWYQNLSLKYQNAFQSNFTFNPIRNDSTNITWFQALLHPSKYRKATGNNKGYQFGFRQQASISASNLLGSQHLNVSAGANYHGYYFPSTIRKSFNPDSNRVEQQRVRGFASARDFSTNLNFSTTIYGISHMHIGNLIAFRHTMRPSISLSYSPDFSSKFFGYYRTVQTDTTGRTRRYSIFQDEVFSGPNRGGSKSISFSIDNSLEAKRLKRDTTGEKKTKTLRLIDQFNLNTSYNFAADSLRLSDLSASLTSSVFSGISLRASANFNFYERNSLGERINKLLLTHTGKPFQLTNFSLNASTSFSGGRGGGVQVNKTPPFPVHYQPYLDQTVFGEMDRRFNSHPVQKINSPWSVSLNFRYSWSLNPNGKNRKSATINASNIQFHLTPKWRFSTSLGFDFIRHKLTPSNFSLTRKLHEWTLSFQMNPFGNFQYYFFRLSVNSGELQSIFQKLPLLKNLSRSSSPTGATPGGGSYGGYGGGGGGF
ncbi:MAG TPA: putative LPS assembly protein LptD [Balneolaceae bacterium]|nr:putative LPS assembly protein LptD [Balneolaceae bacterium]